tara:strand:- start:2558 stop:2926 length:369 start_codon:yes stop_codon:yes gene_type:complete
VGLNQTIKATRIYTGSDQKSHFEDFEIPLNDEGKIGFLSERKKASSLIFRETSGDYDYDWHNAPERQFVIVLEGSVEITVGDGTSKVFTGGQIFLAEDTEGQGHKSRAINNEPRKSIFVTLD